MAEGDDPLLQHAATLLQQEGADVAELRSLVEALLRRCHEQQRLLDRVTHLSDGFQRAERERGDDYLKHYRRELRRVEKIVRISDRYQVMLQEMNGRLVSMANTDALTGLANRRFACDELEKRINLVQRNHGSLCVALVDIDRFKQVNDSFGHAAGDKAIRLIADTLKAGLRDYDLCARWGGEEFLILLPFSRLEDARQLLERLRLSIEIMVFGIGETSFPLTISIGVSEFASGESSFAVLKRADEALYLAKNAGRNTVCSL